MVFAKKSNYLLYAKYDTILSFVIDEVEKTVAFIVTLAVFEQWRYGDIEGIRRLIDGK